MCVSGRLFCRICMVYIKENCDVQFKRLFQKCSNFDTCFDEEFKHITFVNHYNGWCQKCLNYLLFSKKQHFFLT